MIIQTKLNLKFPKDPRVRIFRISSGDPIDARRCQKVNVLDLGFLISHISRK